MSDCEQIIAAYQRGNAVTRAHMWMRYPELRQMFDRLEPPVQRTPLRLRPFPTAKKPRRWMQIVTRHLYGA